MKRLAVILFSVICSLSLLAEEHMTFGNFVIDGPLKVAMKEMKKKGFMGMKIKNVGALIGTLDGEDVMITLMATPKTHTLFSVAVIYEGSDSWDKQWATYQKQNAALAEQYGEPTEVINEWEAPYSLENNPLQAFKEEKAQYGAVYASSNGYVAVNLVYVEGKMCIIIAYIDEKNKALYEQEGGEDFEL